MYQIFEDELLLIKNSLSNPYDLQYASCNDLIISSHLVCLIGPNKQIIIQSKEEGNSFEFFIDLDSRQKSNLKIDQHNIRRILLETNNDLITN